MLYTIVTTDRAGLVTAKHERLTKDQADALALSIELPAGHKITRRESK